MINAEVLSFLEKHRGVLESCNLLMPSYLLNLNIAKVRRGLQNLFKEGGNEELSFASVWSVLDKRIQQARYEQYILKLARAYAGSTMYFPAFIDFRGRISRSGILHFHERDLVRSLLCFSKVPSEMSQYHYELGFRIMKEAAAYHYRAFSRHGSASRKGGC